MKQKLVRKVKEDITVDTFRDFIEFQVNRLGINDNIENIRNWIPNEYAEFIKLLNKIIKKGKTASQYLGYDKEDLYMLGTFKKMRNGVIAFVVLKTAGKYRAKNHPYQR